jgi:hypothetical protein
MNSAIELELHAACHREWLLAEAESERLARQARGARPAVLRARVAATLYALADWLAADTSALERSAVSRA